MTTAVRRVLLQLAVVFAVLVTSGWVARGESPPPDAYSVQLAEWRQEAVAGAALPDPGAPAEEISGFFTGLSAFQQLALARDYPLVVGNLNGAPLQLRYTANRFALGEAEAGERARLENKRLTQAGRRAVNRRANRYESLRTPRRQILAFDPDGRGRAAEVLGDLDRAQRITVIVPGVDNDLLNFERTRLKYSAPVGMAAALHREQRKVAPEVRTAVIAWADYVTPNGMSVAAATAELAEAGAERLTGLLAGLPGDAPVTLVCHSYGSVVCGVAAAELPGRVSDIVAVASPGMRASSAAALDTPARIWATRAPDDWIADVPNLSVGPLGHGIDPVSPEFGALPLSSRRVEGHAGYFEPGTDSLAGFARIGTGRLHELDWFTDAPYCRFREDGTGGRAAAAASAPY
ncbi:alpha/beta hydrolase [Streptomyces sp. YIM 98790]|uniref:alpha/beta hydrolase n=1 Tax=Streptomyces sp. YIM 98790 TaxID=2689077 RepID=UPI001408DBCE|nr:alpha/beta hydrolase [Streptomyces sp. YIM 98790]